MKRPKRVLATSAEASSGRQQSMKRIRARPARLRYAERAPYFPSWSSEATFQFLMQRDRARILGTSLRLSDPRVNFRPRSMRSR